jgi:hypothetical protein
MLLLDLVLIIGLAVLFYGFAPIIGAVINRYSWRFFRRRFNDLRLAPLLDYSAYQHCAHGGRFRFIGNFESMGDEYTLWLRSQSISIPVNLGGRHTYLYSIIEENGKEIGERILWERMSVISERAKVFVGGNLAYRDNRLVFVPSKKEPLLIIFYNGTDRSLPMRAIRAGRNKNGYWNQLTPYAFILGAFAQLLIAVSFLSRPTFVITSAAAFIALFTPLISILPPGLLCTILYNALWRKARQFREYRDVARLPLKYLGSGVWRTLLPNGERYGMNRVDAAPPKHIPILMATERKEDQWYVFGHIDEAPFPHEPDDMFATFGAIQGNPEELARQYARKAYILETAACFFLMMGLGINFFFIIMLIFW